jgi:hypothetical protein
VPGGVGGNPKVNLLGAVEDPVFLRGTSKVYGSKSGLSRIPDFADRKLAFKHYSKHVKGVVIRPKGQYRVKEIDLPEFSSFDEYVQTARGFHSGAPGEGVLEGIRKGGEIVRFDPSTGYFGVRTQQGMIRTFFRPEGDAAARLQYFLDQFK